MHSSGSTLKLSYRALMDPSSLEIDTFLTVFRTRAQKYCWCSNSDKCLLCSLLKHNSNHVNWWEKVHMWTGMSCRRILLARQEQESSTGILQFRVPAINFDADDYIDLVEWQNIEGHASHRSERILQQVKRTNSSVLQEAVETKDFDIVAHFFIGSRVTPKELKDVFVWWRKCLQLNAVRRDEMVSLDRGSSHDGLWEHFILNLSLNFVNSANETVNKQWALLSDVKYPNTQ